MITEADHQGGQVMYPTALPAFLEMYHHLHVATKPTRILVHESEINIIIIIIIIKQICVWSFFQHYKLTHLLQELDSTDHPTNSFIFREQHFCPDIQNKSSKSFIL